MNDIFIFSKLEKKYEKHVQMILKHLKKYSLNIKLLKWEFSKIKINYLKFIISMNNVFMKSSQIFTIKNSSKLQNHKNVQVFLNSVYFFKRVIQKYSRIKKLKKKVFSIFSYDWLKWPSDRIGNSFFLSIRQKIKMNSIRLKIKMNSIRLDKKSENFIQSDPL